MESPRGSRLATPVASFTGGHPARWSSLCRRVSELARHLIRKCAPNKCCFFLRLQITPMLPQSRVLTRINEAWGACFATSWERATRVVVEVERLTVERRPRCSEVIQKAAGFELEVGS